MFSVAEFIGSDWGDKVNSGIGLSYHPAGRFDNAMPELTLSSQSGSMNSATDHRVDRILGFFVSRPNWDPPTHSPTGECVPPLGSGGGHTFLREGGGGSQPTRGQTLWYSRYIQFVLCAFDTHTEEK